MALPVRLIAMALALILAGSVGGGEAPADRALIDKVTAQVRKETGTEPDVAAVVDALNRSTAKLYGEGRYAEAEQAARAALAEGPEAVDPGSGGVLALFRADPADAPLKPRHPALVVPVGEITLLELTPIHPDCRPG